VFAIDAMGEIRAGVVVPALISALGDPTEDVSDAARRALFVITRQDFGVDAQAWAEWWRESAGRHRIEWLIDALVHDLPVVRRAAADELMEETGEYYGYAEDLTPDERGRVQGYYREWWEREGRARFSASEG
jgi:HEAT repeat protein